jgi:hypothetical protein
MSKTLDWWSTSRRTQIDAVQRQGASLATISRLEVAMSEQGWRRFLAAAGVADWVVLYGGAMAVFRVPSLTEAARLAEAVAQISSLDGVLMTLTDGQLTVRLTRGIFQLEERHVALAQAVSAVAREHGATADRTRAQEVQLAIAAQPDAIVDDSNAPTSWILADRAGDRVCIAAWPDGASRPA